MGTILRQVKKKYIFLYERLNFPKDHAKFPSEWNWVSLLLQKLQEDEKLCL